MALIEGIDEKTAVAFVQEIAKTLVPALQKAVAQVLDPVLGQVQGLREEIAALPLSIRDALLPLVERVEVTGKSVVREFGDQVDGLTITNTVTRKAVPK